MTDEHYMHLQHSESVVAQMAATILAGFVQKGELRADNEEELVNRAVDLAIKLANRTDALVKSDEEWVKNSSGSSYLVG